MDKKETLVVISKLKKYIRSASGMNTAGGVAPALSDIVRQMCDEAIEKAKSDGRKTVMDRDFL
jgi:histone H3/H4